MRAINRCLIGLTLLSGLSGVARAADVYLSSNTVTTDRLAVLCGQGKRGFLHGLCVNSGVNSTSMTVVNSSYTMTGSKIIANKITSTSGVGCLYYDTALPNGMLYDKFGTADVTIMYACY